MNEDQTPKRMEWLNPPCASHFVAEMGLTKTLAFAIVALDSVGRLCQYLNCRIMKANKGRLQRGKLGSYLGDRGLSFPRQQQKEGN